jgi:hypothetical protein
MLTVLGIIILDSWTLAALTRTASGMPWTSTTRWRFVLCLPRSVGFLAVSWPLDRSRGGVQGSLQSMRSAWASSSSGTWCKRRQTSALYQSHIPSRQASFKEDTGLQHEQDSRELRPVQHRGSPHPSVWALLDSDPIRSSSSARAVKPDCDRENVDCLKKKGHKNPGPNCANAL